MRKFRCPWCGQEAIDSFRKYNELRGMLPTCPTCGKHFIGGKNRSTWLTVSFGLVKAIVVLMIVLLCIYSLIRKNSFLAYTSAVLFVIVLCLFDYIYTYYFSYLKKALNSYMDDIPFHFTFHAKIKFKPARDGGYRYPSLYFRDHFIFGAKFDTNAKRIRGEEIALVFDHIHFGEDETADCMVGFVLDERISKEFMQVGLTFTLIDNGREFASGIVTDGNFVKPDEEAS